MNDKIKDAIDKFVKNKYVKNRIGAFVEGGIGLLGHTERNRSRVVDADYYEQAKQVIIDTQLEFRIPLTSQEYEDAVKYACKELGF